MYRSLLVLVVLLGACAGAPQAPTHDYFPGDPGLPWRTVGRSVEGRDIYAVSFGSGDDVTLIFGGFHGDERTSVEVALRLCSALPHLTGLLEGRRVVVVPIVNPDGYVQGRRWNARGVDLNRNLPTGDWNAANRRKKDHPGAYPASEPEARAVMLLVQRRQPDKIISLHDPLRVNNYDGRQSRDLAHVMAAHNRYPVSDSVGYPTPGSLGTWAGLERGISIVTLEVPKGDAEARWEENRWALVAAIRYAPAPAEPVAGK
ncbi:MAG: M14 family zinc carboxypeptidase [Planctomycetota bacterium]|jgi:predicted deacylase